MVVVVVVVDDVVVEDVVVLGPDAGAVVVVVVDLGPCPGLAVVVVVVGALPPAGVPFEAPDGGSEPVPGPDVSVPEFGVGPDFGAEPWGAVVDVGRVPDAWSVTAASGLSPPADSPAAVRLS